MPIIVIAIIAVIIFFIVRDNVKSSKAIKEASNDPEYIRKIISKWTTRLSPFEFTYGYRTTNYNRLFSLYFIYLIQSGLITITPDDEIKINQELASDPESQSMLNIIAHFSGLKDGHMYVNVLLENIPLRYSELSDRLQSFVFTIRQNVKKKLSKKEFKEYNNDCFMCEAVQKNLIKNKMNGLQPVCLNDLLNNNFDETSIFYSRINFNTNFDSISELSQLERIAVSVFAVEASAGLAKLIYDLEFNSNDGCGCSSD